jgi:transcriptional regulator with XRE-family HTH domain
MEGHELREALGKNLKTYRFLRGLSQAELAKKANISLTFLSDIERGNKWPYPETLSNLAAALDVPVSTLFTLKQDAQAYAPEDPKDDTIKQFSRDIRRQVDEALETIFRTYQV